MEGGDYLIFILQQAVLHQMIMMQRTTEKLKTQAIMMRQYLPVLAIRFLINITYLLAFSTGKVGRLARLVQDIYQILMITQTK